MTPSRSTPRARLSGPRTGIGTITPSGNTVVEQVTLAILQDFPAVSPHFSRTPVFGETDPFPASYDWDGMLRAAELLGHAHPEVIAWNGSKGGSVDFAIDRDLVARIEALTGAKSTTSTLAIDEVLREDGVKRYAVVSPYLPQYGAKIAATFAREGYECVGALHAGLADNYSFSRVPLDRIVGMVREVARAKPQAIIAVCTNFPAAPVVAELEDELDVPIYDTTAMAVWKSLRLAGVDTRPGRAWGRAFER